MTAKEHDFIAVGFDSCTSRAETASVSEKLSSDFWIVFNASVSAFDLRIEIQSNREINLDKICYKSLNFFINL